MEPETAASVSDTAENTDSEKQQADSAEEEVTKPAEDKVE